ncbi:MAG: hypothetical protein Kow00129_04730 [Thermoleophilia bacterium]
MSGVYAQALAQARAELALLPLEVIRQSSGASLEGERRLELSLLDRKVVVSYPGGVVYVDGRPAALGEELLTLHYLARAAGPMPFAEPARYEGLPGASAYAGAFARRAEAPLAACFASDPGAVREALAGLGAEPARDGQEEGVWRLNFFPYLPLGLRLDLAGEGLPASCSVLFARRAAFLHHVEDLAVAGELLSARLRSMTGAQASDILYTDSPNTRNTLGD